MTLIAKKREVAAIRRVFPWSECQEADRSANSAGKPDDKSLYRSIVSADRADKRVSPPPTGGNLNEPMRHTRMSVQSPLVVLGECGGISYYIKEYEKEATIFMASKKSQKMRIILKAYDHQLIDFASAKLVETVKKTGAKVSGPVPLPTKKEVVTILRAVHKYKDSREQFEQRTHKRLIDVLTPSQKTVDALSRLELPAGVAIDIKMK